MKDSKVVRRSNFELLRIISMFMIILTHTLTHGQVINNVSNGILSIFFEFLFCIIIVHVNSFVLLTGYFQSQSKFKMSRLIQNIDMVWFYRVVILIFLVVINIWHPTCVEVFENVFPLDLGFYWFFDVYILLYCLSPFLNDYLNKISQKEFKKLLAVLFLFFSVLPTVTGLQFFQNNGYTLYSFVFLYFVGAYLRKYPLKNSYLFKKMKKNMFQIICICLFFCCALLNLLLYRFGESIVSYGGFLEEIGNNIVSVTFLYSNSIVILQSIFYFCLFENFEITSKFINKVASLVFGIYLIHDHRQIRPLLYSVLKINNGPISSYHFIWYIFAMALLVFVVCAFIEWIRQVIFKFIYNRKISEKFRKKYRSWIDNMGLEINW